MTIAVLSTIALIVAVASGVVLCSLLGLALITDRFRIWPPQERGNWQFHLSFGLFRVYCGATILFALLDWGSMGWDHWTRLLIGVPVLAIGSIVTVRGYLWLGLDNTYCEAHGLVTTGLYAYSRNPQYVASVLATFGLAITANSWLTLFLAAGLFFVYFCFALNEEPWLRRGYGKAYDEYARTTPRFLDERSFLRAREALVRAL